MPITVEHDEDKREITITRKVDGEDYYILKHIVSGGNKDGYIDQIQDIKAICGLDSMEARAIHSFIKDEVL